MKFRDFQPGGCWILWQKFILLFTFQPEKTNCLNMHVITGIQWFGLVVAPARLYLEAVDISLYAVLLIAPTSQAYRN